MDILAGLGIFLAGLGVLIFGYYAGLAVLVKAEAEARKADRSNQKDT